MKLGLGYKKVIVLASLISLLLLFLLPKNLSESLYGKGIYVLVRFLFNLVSFIPFPIIYIWIALCIYLIWRLFAKSGSMKIIGISILKGLYWGIALFYFMWGFNYTRPSFGAKFPLEQAPMDSISWANEIFFAKNQLEASRPKQLKEYELADIEKLVRNNVKAVTADFGYVVPGRIRVKPLWPKGTLLRIKTAGFYLPHAGEAYIDPGLHPIQQAYTLAHEMCHGYGVTDEGACNFLAYLALYNSMDSTIRYSAHMAYYRYVAGEYRFRFPRSYKTIRDSLPLTIQNDLDEINANLSKYPDFFPKWRDKIYENYLQMQGIKEGMASYDNVIGYVRQYRNAGRIK